MHINLQNLHIQRYAILVYLEFLTILDGKLYDTILLLIIANLRALFWAMIRYAQ